MDKENKNKKVMNSRYEILLTISAALQFFNKDVLISCTDSQFSRCFVLKQIYIIIISKKRKVLRKNFNVTSHALGKKERWLCTAED